MVQSFQRCSPQCAREVLLFCRTWGSEQEQKDVIALACLPVSCLLVVCSLLWPLGHQLACVTPCWVDQSCVAAGSLHCRSMFAATFASVTSQVLLLPQATAATAAKVALG